jgi:AcrR family transcriptional regulator
MSRREHAKQERRQRIVRAARELITETGDASLSMRAIASRAGVSQATPYNLFGTKRAIVLAVLQDVEAFGRRVIDRLSDDPIDRIFDALETMADMYAADPDFYRILWLHLFDPRGNKDVRGDFELSRRAFFRHLTHLAAEEGLLDPRFDIDLVAAQLEQALFGTVSLWLFGYIDVDQLRPMLGFAAGMILTGVVVDAEGQGVTAKTLAYQDAMAGVFAGDR